jgi:predicted permease
MNTYSRDSWGARLAGQVRQDFAYAWRGLWRNPGFTAAALATLTLGIGASTAMFSVVQSVLLSPLPYPEPDRLVAVSSVSSLGGGRVSPTGYADFDDWRRSSHSFDGLAAWDGATVVVDDAAGGSRATTAAYVSPALFDVLQVRPFLGRTFTPEEAARHEPLAVISHSLWRQQFGANPDVTGRTFVVNGRPVQVIGVMPAGFSFPAKPVELWLAESLMPRWDGIRNVRGPDTWRVVARLAPGVALDAARNELSGIAATLARNFPATNTGYGVRLVPLALQVTGPQLRLVLVTLVGAVTAVLLIACSNVANLLLARGAARQREFAVREALGASRRRLIGQLLLESSLLALIAAAAGAALAGALLQGLRTFGPADLPRFDEISLDGLALGFAVCLALASAVASGLLPALRSTRLDLMEMLRGRGQSDGPAARRTRAALVVAEFALAIVLLAAAGLLGRSFVRLVAIDTGFQTERTLLVNMRFPPQRPVEQAEPFARQLLERVRALPGVRAAGITEGVLLDEPNEQVISAEGATPGQADANRLPLGVDAITPDYFRAAGVVLRQGRFFTADDNERAQPVVIINETLARRLWPAGHAVGQRMRHGSPDSDNPWLTVVGVVADLRRQGPDRAPMAQTFRPLAQRPTRGLNMVVATEAEPGTLAASIRAVVVEMDRTVPIARITTLHAELDERLGARKFTLGLIGSFAIVAVILAGIGIFGLMNYTVARRTQEIGVRMALGARPADVLRMVLADGLKLAGGGIAAGLVLSAVLMPVMASLLFGVGLADPLTFGGAIILLTGLALAACYLPARRAVAINPVTALQAGDR